MSSVVLKCCLKGSNQGVHLSLDFIVQSVKKRDWGVHGNFSLAMHICATCSFEHSSYSSYSWLSRGPV